MFALLNIQYCMYECTLMCCSDYIRGVGILKSEVSGEKPRVIYHIRRCFCNECNCVVEALKHCSSVILCLHFATRFLMLAGLYLKTLVTMSDSAKTIRFERHKMQQSY